MRKTDSKLEPRGLLLLGFIAQAIKWSVGLPFGTAGPSYQRSNHCGSGLLRFKSLWVNLLQVKLLWVNLLWVNPLQVNLSQVNHCQLSHQRCNVNKRKGHFEK